MSSSILFPTNEYTTSSKVSLSVMKSSEEIQKLMIPEDVQPTEVFSYLLNKNHFLQKPFVYKNFHKHFQGLISTICQKAVSQTPENQILICESIKIILEKEESLSIADLDEIYKMTVQCLNNLNSVANEPLGEILQILLKVHPNRQELLVKLESQILQLGKSNQPTISKVTSGRLISIISKHIGKLIIKGQMIDILKRILTNNEIEARKVWVTQIFPKLLERLQLEFVELHLQEKIYECVYDQNEQIGVLSLKIILKNITRFSIEEQSSRIVKLFIDSLTSKNERVCIMVTQIMGEVYQKLINIIMKSEANCTRFWRSLVELAQCKNEKILNNLIYNMPGILLLSSKFHRTDPLVEIYCELFYEPLSNKILLMSFFHEIVFLYPSKKEELKEVVYWIFGELFEEEEEDFDIEAIKIVNSLIKNLFKSRSVFISNNQKQLKQNQTVQNNEETTKNPRNSFKNLAGPSQKSLSTDYLKLHHDQTDISQGNNLSGCGQVEEFEVQFCDYLYKFLLLLQHHKNSQWLNVFFQSIKDVVDYLPREFIEKTLLPKIYSLVKAKAGPLELMMEIIVIMLKRDLHNLMNFYASKIHVQFSKSVKSHERQAAIHFLYYSSFYFSIQTFQQYKLGQKFLSFSNDKFQPNRFHFLKYLQRLQYFLTREDKIQMSILVSKLIKENDPEITQALQSVDLTETQEIKLMILEESKSLKEKEKIQAAYSNHNQVNKSLKPLINNHKRQPKELKKQEILKKRIETAKSKTKMLIKEIPKKKSLNLTSCLPATGKTHHSLKKNG